MLHNCDAGEMAVLTTYVNGFVENDGEYFLTDELISVQRLKSMFENGLDNAQAYVLKYNNELLTRPFEVSQFSGHFVFSHGHFILNAGYDSAF